VTGYRSAYLKRDGIEVEFEDEADAKAEAGRLNERTNGNPYRTADFHYSVVRD